MKNDKLVIINGQVYDSVTGKPASIPNPIRKPATAKSLDIKRPSNIHSVSHKHSLPQPKAIKVPTIKRPLLDVKKTVRNMDIKHGATISKFASQPAQKIKKMVQTTPHQMDIMPKRHPITKKVDQLRTPVAKARKSAKTIKEEAIAEAMNKIDDKKIVKKERKKLTSALKKHRVLNIVSISIAALVVIGYITYLNMPSMSVRIASAQAGISATFPDYYPDGYSVNGPVSYNNNEVIIKFRANTGASNFSISQTESSWDSSALREKVNQESDGEFIATTVNGLTIYSYDSNSTWVNGGILYTIYGNAPLSNTQVQKIAVSL